MNETFIAATPLSSDPCSALAVLLTNVRFAPQAAISTFGNGLPDKAAANQQVKVKQTCFDLSAVAIDSILGRHIARFGVSSRKSRQRLKHRLCLAQISGPEPFCEPIIDRRKDPPRFAPPILPCP
jgi:hypothetical protein